MQIFILIPDVLVSVLLLNLFLHILLRKQFFLFYVFDFDRFGNIVNN